MSLSIGSGTQYPLGVLQSGGRRPDPEAQQAAVNAQADMLQAMRTVNLPTQTVQAVTDGKGIDFYM